MTYPARAELKRHFAQWLLCCCLISCLVSCQADSPEQSDSQADVGLLSASIAKNGQYAVLARVNQSATLWNFSTSQALHTWRHEESASDDIILTAISPSGQYALTAQLANLSVWQTKSGKELTRMETSAPIHSVALARHGEFIFIGMINGLGRYIQRQNGHMIVQVRHDNAINKVVLSNDDRLALTGSDDKTAKLWDLASGQLLHSWTHTEAVNSVALSARAHYAFSAAGQQQAMIWDTKTGKLISQLKLRGALAHAIIPAKMKVSCAAFSTDEKYLVTASPPRLLYLWETQTGKQLKSWLLPKKTFWKPPTSMVIDLVVTKDYHVISESSDGMAYRFTIPDNLS